jgi:hypothetical protein
MPEDAVEIPGWNGEELYPCRFCGSTGACEHLMRVIHVDDGNGGKRPVPVHAELGREWGRRRMVALIADLVWIRLRNGDRAGTIA